MSELKVIHAYTFDEIEIISTNSNGNNYYLKSEADKLIAELNMRICEGMVAPNGVRNRGRTIS